MIRVLHYGLGSNLGGIETYLYKLYKNIDTTKVRFDFLTTKDEDVYFKNEFTEMGSRFYPITSRSENPIKNRKELKELFLREKFDIIHCHMNSLSYSAPIFIGVKTNNNIIVHSRNAQAPKSVVTRILHNVNSIFLPKKQIEMLSVSDFAGQWMFGEKADFTVINNGVDIGRFKYNESSRRKIRSELDLDNKFCVIHVGAFRTQKNHMFLLETFRYILKFKRNSRLLLVGAGNLSSEIESKANELGIRDKIIIVGNRSDVPDLLSGADAFLFPSFYEGFPNAVLEAQTSGLPCLISDTITKEVLINSNCSNLSLNKSPREWAGKLLSLSSYENRLTGADTVKEKGFSVEAEVKKIEKLYSQIDMKC